MARKPRGYWTRKNLIKEARKYRTRLEFQQKNFSAYSTAHKKGLLDVCCSHMEKSGSRFKRQHYAIVFEDASVYVGLSLDNTRRVGSHIANSSNPLVNYKISQGVAYKIFLFDDLVDRDKAGNVEDEILEHFVDDLGLFELNINKTGGLGTNEVKWTKEALIKEARKYKTRVEFSKGSNSAYVTAHRNGWLDECCRHMKRLIKPNGYWSKKRVKKIAKKYSTRGEFKKRDGTAYTVACDKGWLDECCGHMQSIYKPMGYWTKERVIKEARKYRTRPEFKKGSGVAYTLAYTRGWADECCKHMVEVQKKHGHWTKERVLKEARKYRTQVEFKRNGKGAWGAAQRNGWLDSLRFRNQII